MLRHLLGSSLVVGLLVVAPPAVARHLSDEPPTCRCSATLGFAAPDLQFQNRVLTFIPRLNVSLRSRGPFEAPAWTATVTYFGKTSPGGEFNGSQDIARGPCGSRFSLRGVQLNPVPLAGLTRTLLGEDQELDGTVELSAAVTGCGFDSEKKMSRFTLKQFGNLTVRGWKTVR